MNICTFSGRLVKDADTKEIKTGSTVTKFCVAVESGFGEHKRTDFINCVLWKREGLSQYLRSGVAVMVTGEYLSKEYTAQDGIVKKHIEIIIRDVEFQKGKTNEAQTGRLKQKAEQNTFLKEDTSDYNLQAEIKDIDDLPF